MTKHQPKQYPKRLFANVNVRNVQFDGGRLPIRDVMVKMNVDASIRRSVMGELRGKTPQTSGVFTYLVSIGVGTFIGSPSFPKFKLNQIG